MEENKGYLTIPLNIEIEPYKFLWLKAQEHNITMQETIHRIIQYYIDQNEHGLL